LAGKTLYHYTSQPGVLGIIQSRSIWATHAGFLNDSSEFGHALKFGTEVAGKIFMDHDRLGAFGFAVVRAIGELATPEVYVASFSEKPDLLSQWRGYCPRGGGFCIGIDAEVLRAFCINRGYRLEKCVYDHEEQVEEIARLVATCQQRFPAPRVDEAEFAAMSPKEQVDIEVEHYERTSLGIDRAKSEAAVKLFCAELATLAPRFKNNGFHEEAEWRIVATAPSVPVKYRPTSSYLAPYIELPVLVEEGTSTLVEVLVGPNPNQARCEESVRMLLRSSGLERVSVACSTIPYNNW
jgi:hypothetical protein